ncbi:hypothetical protein P5G51_006885 [Virgibacillus sp. 179-BFC.A HS]|uniref:Uncharacterized protein n=1 Tax=Tigheibacillus jepli TaxID=3035914 RepID=A0ABU5CFS8_9BACI|nr:hypothetical protein [Virgibacillus sp. 179-BFC.A HS]MDY0405163.1 hypothetical protein [Virgibacillus sp. 179-BFC.A HS]
MSCLKFETSQLPLILFNNDDIAVVYHYGYVDEKEMELDALLTEAENNNND